MSYAVAQPPRVLTYHEMQVLSSIHPCVTLPVTGIFVNNFGVRFDLFQARRPCTNRVPFGSRQNPLIETHGRKRRVLEPVGLHRLAIQLTTTDELSVTAYTPSWPSCTYADVD